MVVHFRFKATLEDLYDTGLNVDIESDDVPLDRILSTFKKRFKEKENFQKISSYAAECLVKVFNQNSTGSSATPFITCEGFLSIDLISPSLTNTDAPSRYVLMNGGIIIFYLDPKAIYTIQISKRSTIFVFFY